MHDEQETFVWYPRRLKKIKDCSPIANRFSIPRMTACENRVFAFSDIYTVSRLSPMYFIIINSRLSAFLERPEVIFIFIWTLALMSFINIAVMFVLNIFKKLTNIKEAKHLAVTVCTIIFKINWKFLRKTCKNNIK